MSEWQIRTTGGRMKPGTAGRNTRRLDLSRRAGSRLGRNPGGNPNGMDGQPPQYGMNENGQYRYSYEDYDRISYGPAPVRRTAAKRAGTGSRSSP